MQKRRPRRVSGSRNSREETRGKALTRETGKEK